MRCNICGKEFGNGTNCQNCGINRVKGLASYSGYSPSMQQDALARPVYEDGRYVNSGNMHISNNYAMCFACGEIIPNDSEYCPKCTKKLKERCPKCGNICSTQYANCNHCGTNRSDFERIREEQEEQYRKEAGELRKKFYKSFLDFWLSVIIFIGGCILNVVWGPFPKLFNIILVIIVGVLWYLGENDVFTNYRIKKYKKDYPDDPRNKYL